MIFFLPLGLILLSALSIALIARNEWRAVRRGEAAAPGIPFRSLVESEIDRLYLSFAFFFKQLGHYLYFYWLLLMRRLVVVFKTLLTLVEKKFSRLIEAARGRGMVGKKGSVSLFLLTISKDSNKK